MQATKKIAISMVPQKKLIPTSALLEELIEDKGREMPCQSCGGVSRIHYNIDYTLWLCEQCLKEKHIN